MNNENIQKAVISAKVELGLKLTPRERAFYLLFVASDEEAKQFIEKEKEASK